MNNNEIPQGSEGLEQEDYNLEKASELLDRILNIAIEVDKPKVQDLKPEHLGDDDIDIIEKFLSWVDGSHEALTYEDIEYYLKARDISFNLISKANDLEEQKKEYLGYLIANHNVKAVLANLIVNKTPAIWGRR